MTRDAVSTSKAEQRVSLIIVSIILEIVDDKT